MSTIAVALKHMLAAGMPHDAIVAAVEEMESSITPARSKGAERQARYRERHKASQSVTSDENVTPTPFPSPPNENNLPPPTHTPENITTRAKAEIFPRPDFAEPQLWRDFLANRKTKRLTNTAAAHDKLLRDIDRESARTGWPPGDVLRACVERGWGAVYEITEQKNGTPRTHRDQSGSSTVNAVQRAIELTGGAESSDAARPASGDNGIGALPYAVRSIGHVQ